MATFTVNDRPALSGADAAADDYVLVWDTSAGTHKKISRDSLLVALGRAGVVPLDGPAGTGRGITLFSNGSLRCMLGINAVAEAGANVGSNVFLNLCSDAGTYTFTPLEITRSNGALILWREVHVPGVGTTAGAANAFIGGGLYGGQLLKSTSSEEYKTAIEPLESWRADQVIDEAVPIWYRSLAPADDPDWSWYGLTAEQMAAIDPRLVQWSYRPSDYEETPVYQTIAGETRQVGVDRQLKEGAVKVPDGVAYERLTVMLLDAVRREKAKVAALEDAVAALTARVDALGA